MSAPSIHDHERHLRRRLAKCSRSLPGPLLRRMESSARVTRPLQADQRATSRTSTGGAGNALETTLPPQLWRKTLASSRYPQE